METVSAGAAAGCALDLTAAGLRKLSYDRAAEVVDIVTKTDDIKSYGEGFIRRFAEKEVEEIVQVQIRRATGGRLLIRVVYVAYR